MNTLMDIIKKIPTTFSIGISILFAFLGQFFFTGEIFTHYKDSNTWEWQTGFTVGLVCLVISAFFSAHFFQNISTDTVNEPPVLVNKFVVYPKWVLLSAVSYIGSLLIYLMVEENLIVEGLWVLSMGLLCIPMALASKETSTDYFIKGKEWGIIVLLTVIGFGLRYWKLLEIPSHVDNDIAFIGINSLKLIETGNYHWFGASYSGGMLAYDQLVAWSMRIFGLNHYGVVMISVIFGTISIPFVYFLGRELGSRRVALISTFLITVCYSHIHFSRILFGSSATLFAIIGCYFLLRGIRTHQPAWYAISGVSIGLGLLTYESSRVMPVLVLAVMAWEYLWQRQVFLMNKRNWFFYWAGMLAGFGPNIIFMVKNFFLFNGRGNDIMLWNPDIWQHEMVTYKATNAFQVIIEQTWRTFLTLQLTGDSSSLFGFQRPMVSAITAVFVLVSTGYCLKNIKKIKYFLLWAWIGLTFIFGGVLTYDPPFWPHLIITLPAVSSLAALGIHHVAVYMENRCRPQWRSLVNWGITGTLIFNGISNWQTYYQYVGNNAGPRVRISRYINSLPQNFHIYLVDSQHPWDEYTFQFFNRQYSGESLIPSDITNGRLNINSPAVFILYKNAGLLPVLQSQYPSGVVKTHENNQKNLVFITYEVTSNGE